MQLRSNGTLAVSKGQFESHSLVQWFKLHNHSLDGTYLWREVSELSVLHTNIAIL